MRPCGQALEMRIREGQFSAVVCDLTKIHQVQRRYRNALPHRIACLLRVAHLASITGIAIAFRSALVDDESLRNLQLDGIIGLSLHDQCRYVGHLQNRSPEQLHGLRLVVLDTRGAGEDVLCQCSCAPAHDHSTQRRTLQPREKKTHIHSFDHHLVLEVVLGEIVNRRLCLGQLNGHVTSPKAKATRLRSSIDERPQTGTACSITSTPASIPDQDANQPPDALAFPTAAKEKAKLRKAAGIKPVKKPKIVEDHFDDLGDDLSGLGVGIELLAVDIQLAVDDVDRNAPDAIALASVHNLTTFWCLGRDRSCPSEAAFKASNCAQLTEAMKRIGPRSSTFIELSGAAPLMTVNVRSAFADNVTQDAVTKFDCSRGESYNEFQALVDGLNPDVVVLSPRCRTLGDMCHNFDAFERAFNQDQPLVDLCCHIARSLRASGREFVLLTSQRRIQSQSALSTDGGPYLPFVASSFSLTTPLQNNASDVTPSIPLRADTLNREVRAARIVEALSHRVHTSITSLTVVPSLRGGEEAKPTVAVKEPWTQRDSAFPTAGTDNIISEPRETEGARDPPLAVGAQGNPTLRRAGRPVVRTDGETFPIRQYKDCPACRKTMSYNDPGHTRISGQCAFPGHDPREDWTCPGCCRSPPHPRGHVSHTDVYGECRWGTVPSRIASGSTQHPREATLPSNPDVNHDLRGPDLNEGAASSSSSDAAAARDASARAAARDSVEPPREDARGQRGPDLQPRRQQPRIVDAASGAAPVDWTSFDVSQSFRLLKSGTAAQRIREVRKLHLRWWHANRSSMERIFRAAGFPTMIIELVRHVVTTCTECRAWASPGPQPSAAIRLVTKQNESVEADILFFTDRLIWHMLDECDRWHAAVLVPNKETQTLLDAIMSLWIQLWGPFKFLVIDGESAIHSHHSVEFLKSRGITLRPKAPGQHARMLDRRGAILRHTMHCMEAQCRKEGIPVTTSTLLAEAVFSGNALISQDGATPYNCRLGKQPAMLPDLSSGSHSTDGRHLDRVREIAIQKTVQATAIVRIKRASRAVTSVPGERLNFKPGDLIDFHRPPANKDTSGWHGPATVLENKPDLGQVNVKFKGKTIHAGYPDVRDFMDFVSLVYLSSSSAAGAAVSVLLNFVASLPKDAKVAFGFVYDGISWAPTRSSIQNRNVALAIQTVVKQVLNYSNVFSVRVVKGAKYLQPCPNALRSLVYSWRHNFHNPVTFEADDNGAINLYALLGEEYPNYSTLQLLFSDGQHTLTLDALLDSSYEAPPTWSPARAGLERLSTIEEAEEESDVATGDATDSDGEELVLFSALGVDYSNDRAHIFEPEVDMCSDRQSSDASEHEVGYHFHSVNADPDLMYTAESDEAGNQYVDMLFPEENAKLICDAPPPEGLTARLRVYLSPNAAIVKKAVIERDTDLLTPDEYISHKKAVDAAVHEELVIWADHKTFNMRPRKGARNILDVRWVGKWKWVKSTSGAKVRIIRMRMTLRGFKDRDSGSFDTFAGTASRLTQKIVVSEAVIRGWPLATIDVKKAFLKGISYKDLAEVTGEPEREVNFEVTPTVAMVLRTVPGFETFDCNVHVLHCLVPGTGCKDAPYAFGLKLTFATNHEFGAIPTTHDSQLIVRFGPDKKRTEELTKRRDVDGEEVKFSDLDFLASKHVDDIKAGCDPKILKVFVQVLESVFGKGELDLTIENFTNTGIRHTYLSPGYRLDQLEYVAALKPITHPQLVGAKNEAECPASIATLFLSLLMAMAYAIMTRSDCLVYVIALQRHAQKPSNVHVRRLNALVRWAQSHPITLDYLPFKCAKELMVFGDAGFRKEEDADGNFDGKAVRGTNYLRTSVDRLSCHLLEAVCGTMKQVNRSTYTAEGQNLILSADSAIVLSQTMSELQEPPVSPEIAMRQVDQGGFWNIILVTDSKNVVISLEAPVVKMPAEKSFVNHLLWLRQKFQQGVLKELWWADTRDMNADGHTKGSVPRAAIHELCKGKLKFLHPHTVMKVPKLVEVRALTDTYLALHQRGKTCSSNDLGDGPECYVHDDSRLCLCSHPRRYLGSSPADSSTCSSCRAAPAPFKMSFPAKWDGKSKDMPKHGTFDSAEHNPFVILGILEMDDDGQLQPNEYTVEGELQQFGREEARAISNKLILKAFRKQALQRHPDKLSFASRSCHDVSEEAKKHLYDLAKEDFIQLKDCQDAMLAMTPIQREHLARHYFPTATECEAQRKALAAAIAIRGKTLDADHKPVFTGVSQGMMLLMTSMSWAMSSNARSSKHGCGTEMMRYDAAAVAAQVYQQRISLVEAAKADRVKYGGGQPMMQKDIPWRIQQERFHEKAGQSAERRYAGTLAVCIEKGIAPGRVKEARRGWYHAALRRLSKSKTERGKANEGKKRKAELPPAEIEAPSSSSVAPLSKSAKKKARRKLAKEEWIEDSTQFDAQMTAYRRVQRERQKIHADGHVTQFDVQRESDWSKNRHPRSYYFLKRHKGLKKLRNAKRKAADVPAAPLLCLMDVDQPTVVKSRNARKMQARKRRAESKASSSAGPSEAVSLDAIGLVPASRLTAAPEPTSRPDATHDSVALWRIL